jgi:hypothetical protein
MGSVASTSNGLSDLLQTLTNQNSPLLSTVSSPTVEKALENAPASDIVQISDEAMQLQEAETLFGAPNVTSTSTDALFGITPAPTTSSSPPSSSYDVFA